MKWVCIFALQAATALGYSQSFSLPLKACGNISMVVTLEKSSTNHLYYLKIPGVTPVPELPINLTSNALQGTVRKEILVNFNKLYSTIVSTCPAGISTNVGNIDAFINYFADDASAFFFRDPSKVNRSVALGINYLKLIQAPDGSYVISESFSPASSFTKDIISIHYPNGSFDIHDAAILNNQLLLDNLNLIVDLLEKIDAKYKPHLFLVKNFPGYRLLLYTNEDKYQLTSVSVVSDGTASKFIGDEQRLPDGAGPTGAVIVGYSVKSSEELKKQ